MISLPKTQHSPNTDDPPPEKQRKLPTFVHFHIFIFHSNLHCSLYAVYADWVVIVLNVQAVLKFSRYFYFYLFEEVINKKKDVSDQNVHPGLQK